MFHYVRGVPFDFNSGAYDNLNMWEQIDNGDQYTPAKKFLLMVPIGLFLISTHYTRYDLTYFIINTLATLAVLIPNLPSVCITSSQRNSHTDDWTGTQASHFIFLASARRCIDWVLRYGRRDGMGSCCNFACISIRPKGAQTELH